MFQENLLLIKQTKHLDNSPGSKQIQDQLQRTSLHLLLW